MILRPRLYKGSLRPCPIPWTVSRSEPSRSEPPNSREAMERYARGLDPIRNDQKQGRCGVAITSLHATTSNLLCFITMVLEAEGQTTSSLALRSFSGGYVF